MSAPSRAGVHLLLATNDQVVNSSSSTRPSAASHDAPANVSGRRYLTLVDLSDGCQVYLGT
jgi:hypothetical protein